MKNTMQQRPHNREHAYSAIDTERDYQNARWGRTAGEPTGHNPHSVTEWLTYMRHYVEEGLTAVTLGHAPQAGQDGLEFVRKVAGLGVACMEQHGAPHRMPESIQEARATNDRDLLERPPGRVYGDGPDMNMGDGSAGGASSSGR